MDSREMDKLLREGLAELRNLRPRARKLGVVKNDGKVACLHDETVAEAPAKSGRVLPFNKQEDL